MELNILIVDDDATICSLHCAFLEFMHVKNPVEIFLGGESALSYLDNNASFKKNRYLILLDINMPTISGWDFLDELQHRSYKDQCQVAIVSSSPDENDKNKAATYPQVFNYYIKPLSIKKFEDILTHNTIKDSVERELVNF